MDANSILTELLSHLITPYLVSVIMLTFLVLYFIIPKPKTWIKKVVHLVVGLILAIIWHYTSQASIDNLIFTFLLSVFLYSWFIKVLTDRFNIDYNNDTGLYFKQGNAISNLIKTDINSDTKKDAPEPDTQVTTQTVQDNNPVQQ